MMRLGLNVPNFGPEANPGTLMEWAQFAETERQQLLEVKQAWEQQAVST